MSLTPTYSIISYGTTNNDLCTLSGTQLGINKALWHIRNSWWRHTKKYLVTCYCEKCNSCLPRSSNLHKCEYKESNSHLYYSQVQRKIYIYNCTFFKCFFFILIIIIIIYCNWVVTRWQWLFYMYPKHEIGYYWI